MQLISHRGLKNEIYGENTIGAFKNAINNNFDGIELDVRITKDNELVVIHDSFINRTSDGTGRVSNYTYKELLKFNFGTKKKKAYIPKLEEVIKKFNNIIIFVELKEKVNKFTLEKILSKNKTNIYYVFSHNKNIMSGLKSQLYKVGLINYVFNSYVGLDNIEFILILEDFISNNILKHIVDIGIEPVIYNTISKINYKNKELINNYKYII